MNTIQQQTFNENLSPQRVQQKSDILESNLFKSISQQTDSSKIHLKIDRDKFPDVVIYKALLQLLPRFNIKPVDLILGLKDLLQKDISNEKQKFLKTILNQEEAANLDDANILTRNFEAIASKKRIGNYGQRRS